MSQDRLDRAIALVPAVLLASFSLFWFSYTVADPDLWGHLRFGLDIVQTGAIAQKDVYSYRTGTQPWINHEWLSEVIFAWLYDLAGPAGLVAFKVIASGSIVGLVLPAFAWLRSRSTSRGASVDLDQRSVSDGLGDGSSADFHLSRYADFASVPSGRRRRRRKRRLWALPLLFALWVNLHGGVLAGIGILGLWTMAAGIRLLLANRSGAGSNLGEFA